MELGKRLREARLELGISQRQLCGDTITRNMLSKIENGSATPSLETLGYLAAALGKPVSFFLEENAVTSANQQVMAEARQAYRLQNYGEALKILEKYRRPDPVFDDERGLLLVLSRMGLAQQSLDKGRGPYARQLLESAGQDRALTSYYTAELERRRLLLLAAACPEQAAAVGAALPPEDDVLLLRGQLALEQGKYRRCIALLDACENQSLSKWHYLRGEALFALKDYRAAAEQYHAIEDADPEHSLGRLESCYREMEDYKMAYAYACKRRNP